MFTPFAFITNTTTFVPAIIPPAPPMVLFGSFRSYGQPKYQDVVKLTTGGAVATDFNVGTGVNGLTNLPYRILPLSNGKLLLFGGFDNYQTSAVGGIVRLNADGTRDTAFNVGVGFGSSYAYDAVEQPDGKVVLIGQFSSYSGSSVNNIVRLNTNGTRDTTFTIGTGLNSVAYGLRLEPNGKIVVAGAFTTYSGSSATYTVRINDSGSRDATWTSVNTSNPIYTIDRQSDGKYLIGGSFTTPGLRTARLDVSGSTDATWTCSPNSNVYYIKQTPTGKVIMLGDFTSVTANSANAIFRALNSGSIDSSFKLGTGFPDGNNFTVGTTAAVLSDDSIFVPFLRQRYSGSFENGLVNILPSGSINDSFSQGSGVGRGLGAGGRIGGGAFGGIGVTMSGSGHLFVVGQFKSYNVSPTFKGGIMLTPSASISSSFNIGVGFTGSAATGLIGSVQHVARLSTGKYVAVGAFQHYSGSAVNYITGINASGSIDTSFNVGTGFNSEAYIVRATSDDKVVVFGTFSSYSGSSVNTIVRINSNGTRDTTFGGGALNGSIFDMQIQSDGKVVAVGNFTTYSGSSCNRIMRTNPDGTLDATFSIGTGLNLQGESIQIQPDGKILVAGLFLTYAGVTVNRIVRLNNSGSRDTDFTSTGFNSLCPLIKLRPDGNILAFTQNATTYNGATFANVVCIQNSGSRYTPFASPTSFIYDGDMNQQQHGPDIVAVDSNNYAYIGGKILAYNGVSSPGLIRISDIGGVDSTYMTGSDAWNGMGSGFDEMVTTLIPL